MSKPGVIRKTHLTTDELLGRLKGPLQVKVGFPAGTDGDIITRAMANEFGTKRIPERPFMRNAMRANQDKYSAAMGKAAGAVLKGETSLRQVLGKLGAMAQGDIQKEIRDLDSPPNAPGTVARKKSSNPLIDTGEMRQRVTWKVDD